MTTSEIATSILGSSLVTAIVGFIIGRRKEDIEIALKYQEFYQKHIADLKQEINELSKKVEILIEHDKKKETLIKEQKLNLLRWEENCVRLELIIKEKDKQIAKLIDDEED